MIMEGSDRKRIKVLMVNIQQNLLELDAMKIKYTKRSQNCDDVIDAEQNNYFSESMNSMQESIIKTMLFVGHQLDMDVKFLRGE